MNHVYFTYKVVYTNSDCSTHFVHSNINLAGIAIYRLSGIFCIGKLWRKWRLEGVLNFHWVLFSLFQGLSMKMYCRVYFLLCLFLAISGRSRTQQKLNPHEKFLIYGRFFISIDNSLPIFIACYPFIDNVDNISHCFVDFFCNTTWHVLTIFRSSEVTVTLSKAMFRRRHMHSLECCHYFSHVDSLWQELAEHAIIIDLLTLSLNYFTKSLTLAITLKPGYGFHISHGPLQWRRGSGLDCGSEDPGSIPGIPSPHMGPLMARRLSMSSEALPMLG